MDKAASRPPKYTKYLSDVIPMKKNTTQFIAYSPFAFIALPVAIASYAANTVPDTAVTAAADIAEEEKEEKPAENGAAVFEEPSEAVTALAQTIDKENLENYIVCVVAAEMPALFNIEALKAQAVAARTYAVNQMEANGFTLEDMIAFGGQAYIDSQGMRSKWGDNYEVYYSKIKKAVEETKGEIMVYEGEPILAVFHAISRGKTETAENVWQQDVPYLQSVESEGDTKAAEYKFETSMPSDEIIKLLSEKYNGFAVEGDLFESMETLSQSPAGYILKIKIGNMTFTGRQVREALGLRSADFTYKKDGESIVFTTNGYGHGAGMSQYGAHYLAEEGKTYKEILAHYYTGISFSKIE